MKEELIIEQVLENLPKELKIKANWKQVNNGLDGKLHTNVNGKVIHFNAEVKNEIRQVHLKTLAELNQQFENFLLIAYRLYPQLKEQLRERGINYMEANGNLFINKEGLFIYIDAHAPLTREKQTGNRAFTKTGLKVVFQLLLNPDLVNQTQREIATRANVALGNIPKVIQGLNEAGYLLKYDKNTYRFTEKEALIEKWTKEYAMTLRPTLEIGKYQLAGNQPWKEIKIKEGLTKWGGEAAGDLLTHYLRPELLTIYTRETRKELMKNYRLIPNKVGDIEVLTMFWQPEDVQNRTVPPLLAYADLINTNDKRCAETAQLIFDEHIRPNL